MCTNYILFFSRTRWESTERRWRGSQPPPDQHLQLRSPTPCPEQQTSSLQHGHKMPAPLPPIMPCLTPPAILPASLTLRCQTSLPVFTSHLHQMSPTMPWQQHQLVAATPPNPNQLPPSLSPWWGPLPCPSIHPCKVVGKAFSTAFSTVPLPGPLVPGAHIYLAENLLIVEEEKMCHNKYIAKSCVKTNMLQKIV